MPTFVVVNAMFTKRWH